MLRSLQIEFSVHPSGFDEASLKQEIQHLPVAQQALRLAAEKALAVSRAQPQKLIIGGDQICELSGVIFNKPGSFDAAVAQLQALAGRSHTQHSAVVLAQNGQLIWQHNAQAQLTMRNLNSAEITAYVSADMPLQACGAYHFESLGKHLFAEIIGDHSVIQGMPLLPLLNELYRLGAVRLGG
jgi:septum formation protein